MPLVLLDGSDSPGNQQLYRLGCELLNGMHPVLGGSYIDLTPITQIARLLPDYELCGRRCQHLKHCYCC
jgi:hypothetical protein